MPTRTTATLNGVSSALVIPLDDSAQWLINEVMGALANSQWANQWEQGTGGAEVYDVTTIIANGIRDSFMLDLVGLMIPYMGTDQPANLLELNGQTVPRAEYPRLWAKLPNEHKDTTTIFLPDLRNKFIMGGDWLSVAEEGGSNDHTLTTAEMPSHAHTTLPHAHAYGGVILAPLPEGGLAPLPATVPSPSITGTADVVVNSTGGGLPHENRPAFYTVRYMVIAR